MNRIIFLGMLIPALLCACVVTPRIDPGAFAKDPAEKMQIPPACKKAYESAIPRVAVANVTNNTTFDYAKMVEEHVAGKKAKSTAGGVAAVVAPGAAAVVWGTEERTRFKKDSVSIERNINAKLSESAEDGIIDELVNIGGAKVYTRTEIQKILDEQKFQNSGLVDDTNLVKLGNIAGVKYLATGSVDNVKLSYLSLAETKKSIQDSPLGNLIKDAMSNAVEGWHVQTEVTVRMLDVETGEIILAKKVNGKEILGKMPYPSYDALIGGIKKAVTKSLKDIRPEISKFLSIKGYIMQTKSSPDGKEKIVLINVGGDQGLRPGYTMIAYSFEEVQDPLTGKISCDQQKLPIELKVSDQVQSDKAWCTVICEPDYLKYLKPGQLIERAPLEGQGILRKMGY